MNDADSRRTTDGSRKIVAIEWSGSPVPVWDTKCRRSLLVTGFRVGRELRGNRLDDSIQSLLALALTEVCGINTQFIPHRAQGMGDAMVRIVSKCAYNTLAIHQHLLPSLLPKDDTGGREFLGMFVSTEPP